MKTKKTIAAKRTTNAFIAINIHDWRMAMATGMVVGMLIVGLPQILGVALLLSMLIIVLKLVEKDRI